MITELGRKSLIATSFNHVSFQTTEFLKFKLKLVRVTCRFKTESVAIEMLFWYKYKIDFAKLVSGL